MNMRHQERVETLAYWPVSDVEKNKVVGLVTNLTDEGLHLHSPHEFPKGRVMTLRIILDPRLTGLDYISLVVENVWCSASSTRGLYHAGFKIVDMTDDAKRQLRELFQLYSYVPSVFRQNSDLAV